MLCFDVESVPRVPAPDLPDDIRAKLVASARHEDEARDRLTRLAVEPFFARIVSIAAEDTDAGKRIVLLACHAPASDVEAWTGDGEVWRACATEAELLTRFWAIVSRRDRFLTFGGRHFDVPLLEVRSAALGVDVDTRLTRSHRYNGSHVDVFDRVSGHGAAQPRGGLVGLAHALGVDSPKGDLDGAAIADAWARGQYARIGRYNLGDVICTTECARRLGYLR